jgi:hypothetical protein
MTEHVESIKLIEQEEKKETDCVKSTVQLENELEKKVSLELIPRINQDARTIDIYNAPWSLIPAIECQMKAEYLDIPYASEGNPWSKRPCFESDTVTIPLGTPFYGYKILDFVFLSISKKTVSFALELDQVADVPSLEQKLKMYEFVSVLGGNGVAPETIRAERAVAEVKSKLVSKNGTFWI